MDSISPTEKSYFSAAGHFGSPQNCEEYGEERWRGIGAIRGRVVVAVFTEPRQGVIRFISLRKANREEQRLYEEAIKNELGTH